MICGRTTASGIRSVQYPLRNNEDFGKLASQAGHTERISLKHYLILVSKDEAEAFWNIFLGETLG